MLRYLFLLFISVCLPMLSNASQPMQNTNNKLLMQIVQDQFIFDSSNVQSVTLHFAANGAYDGINIKLKKTAIANMQHFTGNGVGKTLNLVFNNKIVTSAMIQSALGEQFLVVGISRLDASDFMKMLAIEKPVNS
jgi:preprotein translocase subunit SecD